MPRGTPTLMMRWELSMQTRETRTTGEWKDYWAMVPRYERWIESIGVPVHRTYYVQDLRTLEVGPWEEPECNAAVVVLEGNKDFMETRVTEIPAEPSSGRRSTASTTSSTWLPGRGSQPYGAPIV